MRNKGMTALVGATWLGIFYLMVEGDIRFAWRMKRWPWRFPVDNRIYIPGSNE